MVTLEAELTGAAARRERGRREMRAAILAAARQIVTEQGTAALQMRTVASAIGYSVAALYEYFPSKKAILAGLYFEGTEGLAGKMRAALTSLPASAPASDRLGALGRAYRAFAHEQTEVFRILCGGAGTLQEQDESGLTSTAGDEAAAKDDEAFRMLLDVARDGVERGEFAQVEPMTIAMAAWSSVHGYVMLELDHLSRDMPTLVGQDVQTHPFPHGDGLFDRVMAIFMDGLRRR